MHGKYSLIYSIKFLHNNLYVPGALEVLAKH